MINRSNIDEYSNVCQTCIKDPRMVVMGLRLFRINSNRTSHINLESVSKPRGVSIGPYFIVKATYALISCREIHGLSDKGQAISE